MATVQEIKRETKLLTGLGLPKAWVWPVRFFAMSPKFSDNADRPTSEGFIFPLGDRLRSGCYMAGIVGSTLAGRSLSSRCVGAPSWLSIDHWLV